MIALDHLVLSRVSNSGYSELFVAPGLVDFIEIERTPLLTSRVYCLSLLALPRWRCCPF